MSNSNAFPSQMAPTPSSYNAGTGYGLQPSSQSPSSSSASNAQSYRTDSLNAAQQKEDVPVPLLSSVTGKEVLSDLSIEGIGKMSVAEVAFVIAALVSVGIPLGLELRNTRAFTRLHMKREEFQHVVYDAHRSAKEATFTWSRDFEKTNNIDAGVVELIKGEMHERLQAYKNVVKTDPTNHFAIAKAKANLDEMQIPIDEEPALHKHTLATLHEFESHIDHYLDSPRTDGAAVLKNRLNQIWVPKNLVDTNETAKKLEGLRSKLASSEHDSEEFKANCKEARTHLKALTTPTGTFNKPLGTKFALGSSASFLINFIYHHHLGNVKAKGAGDGDVLRGAQMLTEGHAKRLVGRPALEHEALPWNGRYPARLDEFNTKLLDLQQQAVHRLIKEDTPQTKFDPNLHQEIGESFAAFQKMKNSPDEAFSLKKLGFKNNLVDGTFVAPRQQAAIKAAIEKFKTDKSYVLSETMSANFLDLVHPGVIEHAPHLHPSQIDSKGVHLRTGATGQNNDQKLVRVVWGYKLPEDGVLHPEPLKLPDGGIIAAWLTSEESEADSHMLEQFEARCTDRLAGNKHALDDSRFKRIWHGLMYRFQSYGRGTVEGLSSPRFNGMIASNLIVTSIPVSSLLYFVFYGEDYWATKQAEETKKKKALDKNPPPTTVFNNPPMAYT